MNYPQRRSALWSDCYLTCYSLTWLLEYALHTATTTFQHSLALWTLSTYLPFIHYQGKGSSVWSDCDFAGYTFTWIPSYTLHTAYCLHCEGLIYQLMHCTLPKKDVLSMIWLPHYTLSDYAFTWILAYTLHTSDYLHCGGLIYQFIHCTLPKKEASL